MANYCGKKTEGF